MMEQMSDRDKTEGVTRHRSVGTNTEQERQRKREGWREGGREKTISAEYQEHNRLLILFGQLQRGPYDYSMHFVILMSTVRKYSNTQNI